MFVYSLPKEYRFDYWSTAQEEFLKIDQLSRDRVSEWSMSASQDEKSHWKDIHGIIPAQFLISLSVQVSQALHLLVEHDGAEVESITGIHLQRVPEVESNQEILFILGFSFGESKFFVSTINVSDRLHHELNAVLLGTYGEVYSKEETVH